MFRRLTKSSFRRMFTSEQNLNEWQKVMVEKKLVEHDNISASQFNLMGNTLNDPCYSHGHVPAVGTELPPAWHLAYFPPRVPETALSSDGFEKDWQPPQFPHRMWAGGELQWNPENPLRVGDHAKMESSIRDVQFRPGGRRGDSVFVYVDKHMSNERGWAATESRCWVYVKDNGNGEKSKKTAVKKDLLSADIRNTPDFSLQLTPSPILLFRFSALTFNSHLIHYDHVYSTTVEHQKGCLVHGPLSFTLMVHQLNQYIKRQDPKQSIHTLNYRCLSPLVVNQPITVGGKKKEDGGFDLWVLDDEGHVAVKGTASIGLQKN